MNEIEQSQSKDTFARIEAYYLHEGKLSPKEKEIAERMELAFALLCQHRSKKVVVSKMLLIQKRKGLKLGVAQAWRDIAEAEQIFTPIQQYSKEFLRLTLIENGFRRLKQIQSKLKDKDLNNRDFAMLLKAETDINNQIILAGGIKDEDPNLPDWSKVQPHTFNINVPEKFIEMFKKVSGSVDITDMMSQFSEDVDDLNEDEDGEESEL